MFDLKTCLNYKEEQVASTMLEVLCLHVYYRQVAPMELKTYYFTHPLARFCKACVALAKFSYSILFASQHPSEICFLNFTGQAPITNRRERQYPFKYTATQASRHGETAPSVEINPTHQP